MKYENIYDLSVFEGNVHLYNSRCHFLTYEDCFLRGLFLGFPQKKMKVEMIMNNFS